MITSFTSIGANQLYNVPPGYNTFDIECWGTDGANSTGSALGSGGRGGYIKGRFTGLSGFLTIDIGGTGAVPLTYYRGGNGASFFGITLGSGGAGAGVRLGVGPDALIVAGGGGGGGLQNVQNGGVGGASIGGTASGAGAGTGGTQATGGVVGGAQFIGGSNGSGGGGGGGFYGGGAGVSVNQGSRGAGGGGSNGFTLPPGVTLIGSVVTLPGDAAQPAKPPGAGVNIGAIRITPICFLALYTGQLVDYTVPEGVQCLDVQLWGANGGASQLLGPTLAGYCEGQIQVVSGDVFNLSVGQAGGINTAGISPGSYCPGGAANAMSTVQGGGGGAGTAMVFSSSVVIAAGGGGGSSGCFVPPTNIFLGGDGGGIVGSDGAGYPLSGQGGQVGAPGAGGVGNSMNGSSGSGGAGGDGAQGIGNCGTGGGGGGFTGGGGGGTSDAFLNPIVGSGGGGSSNYDPASPRSVLLFNTIPDITAPANPDSVTGNGAICIVPAACVCVAQGTLVQTSRGMCPIEKLNPGDLVPTVDGSMDMVRQVIRNKATASQLVQCEANCFSKNNPMERLLITPTHPMLIQGYEMNGCQLIDSRVPGVSFIRNSDRIPVYTVITDRRTFISMNGVQVGTWSEASWNNFRDNDEKAQYI